jgi:hypothetical protein
VTDLVVEVVPPLPKTVPPIVVVVEQPVEPGPPASHPDSGANDCENENIATEKNSTATKLNFFFDFAFPYSSKDFQDPLTFSTKNIIITEKEI